MVRLQAEEVVDRIARAFSDAEQVDDVPAAQPPPSGWYLLRLAAGHYRTSLWLLVTGPALAVAGVLARHAHHPVAVALATLPAGWLAARLSRLLSGRRNRRVDNGKTPDGRRLRAAEVARRSARSTVVTWTVGGWLLAVSTVDPSGVGGGVVWAASVACWAALLVPSLNTADARRRRPADAPTADGFDALTDGPTDPSIDGYPTGPFAQVEGVVAPADRRSADTRQSTRQSATVGGRQTTANDAPTVALPTGPHQPPIDGPGPADGTPPIDPPMAVTVAPDGTDGRWRLPPLSLLSTGGAAPRQSAPAGSATDAPANAIRSVLREFGVDARVASSTVGPTVTRYHVVRGRGVAVAKITGRVQEIESAVKSPVRIIPSIPGVDAVGVEVANRTRTLVTLGDLLAALPRARRLDVALGVGIDGGPVTVDPADPNSPHILIAGTSGAGKSVELNAILVGLLARMSPDEAGLVLVDPKQVELAAFHGVPHLIAPPAVDLDGALSTTEALVQEMERRYELFAAAGVRDLAAYNAGVVSGRIAGRRLARLFAAYDEIADLMLLSKERAKRRRRDEDPGPDFEALLVRLLQKARAAGIHLILATQSPRKDVVTGLIKANLNVRVAFAVPQRVDSMVIIDQPGAEKLLGRGDGLLMIGSVLLRFQAAWVSPAQIDAVVRWWLEQGGPSFELEPTTRATRVEAAPPVQARDVVLAAAREIADLAGGFDKPSLVLATPGMKSGTRDRALTDLVGDGELERTQTKGGYRIAGAATDVDGVEPSGDGDL